MNGIEPDELTQVGTHAVDGIGELDDIELGGTTSQHSGGKTCQAFLTWRIEG